MPSRGPRNAGGPPRAVFIAARSVSFRPPGRHYSCMATPTAPTVSARIGCRRMAPGKASLFPYFRRCVMSKHRRFAPRVELLEHRWCPSCTVTVHGDVMRIVGDGGVNAVTVTDDGAGNVTAACDTASATGSGIRKIIIDTKGGADTVTVDVTGELTTRLDLRLELGSGNDTADLAFAAISDELKVKADLGSGNDMFAVN